MFLCDVQVGQFQYIEGGVHNDVTRIHVVPSDA